MTKSNESYDSLDLFRMTPVSCFVIDSHGKILDANIAALRLLHIESKNGINNEFHKYIHANNNQTYCEFVKKLFLNHSIQKCEIQIRDESSIDHHILLEAQLNSDATFALLSAIDTTKYKAAEQERLILSMAIEQSPVSTMVTDRTGHIQYVNQQFTRMTGYSLEEVKGRKPVIFKGERTSSKVYSQLWDTIQSGNTWEGEFHNRKKDGTFFWEKATISPVLNSKSFISNFIALKEDITEAKRNDHALRMLIGVNDALIYTESEKGFLNSICQIAIHAGDFLLAWIGFIQYDPIRSISCAAHSGFNPNCQDMDQLSWGESDSVGTMTSEKKVIIISDLRAETPDSAPFKMAIDQGAISLVGLPVYQNNIVIGYFFLFSVEIHKPFKQEMLLYEELSEKISFGLSTCRARVEQARLRKSVIALAQGASSGSNLEFFHELNKHLVQALGGDAGCIALINDPEIKSAKTISVLFNGQIQENFEYHLEGTPCEEVANGDYLIIPSDAIGLFPNDECLLLWGMNAYAGISLVDNLGKKVGLMSVVFRKTLVNFDHIILTLKIFASRATGELQHKVDIAKLNEQSMLIDKANDAIISLDLDDRIQVWNESAVATYGWTRDEVLGKTVNSVFFANAEIYKSTNEKLLKTGEWLGELKIKNKNGKDLTIDSRWTLVNDTANRPRSKLFIGTDITEKKLYQTNANRAQRMESIGTLAGGIAHDLNNVFAPIMLSLETLRESTSDKDCLHLIKSMESSAKRGAGLVKQVLTFVRGVEGVRHTVNVKHLFKEIQTVATDTFPKNIQFSVNAIQDPWPVMGDSTQLHQIFMNLCVNARDAMPRGGQLDVNIDNVIVDETYASMNPGSHVGQYVVVTVRDTGTGIAPGDLEFVFDPFFTTKEIGKGTGLGLSTSMAIVKGHSGFICFCTEVGKGTEFRVYLPFVQISDSDEKVQLKSKERISGRDELILIVDDEEAIRLSCKKTLETYGYRTISASNGIEALALYVKRQDDIAVVLTDISMPVMDGNALIAALYELNPEVQIIASSGLSAIDALDPLSKRKVCLFLHKSYTTYAVLDALDTALRHQKMS
ncbi:PAS domain S-box protein [bacterium]|nr:PAS domain S-box protein [bacterium]